MAVENSREHVSVVQCLNAELVLQSHHQGHESPNRNSRCVSTSAHLDREVGLVRGAADARGARVGDRKEQFAVQRHRERADIRLGRHVSGIALRVTDRAGPARLRELSLRQRQHREADAADQQCMSQRRSSRLSWQQMNVSLARPTEEERALRMASTRTR